MLFDSSARRSSIPDPSCRTRSPSSEISYSTTIATTSWTTMNRVSEAMPAPCQDVDDNTHDRPAHVTVPTPVTISSPPSPVLPEVGLTRTQAFLHALGWPWISSSSSLSTRYGETTSLHRQPHDRPHSAMAAMPSCVEEEEEEGQGNGGTGGTALLDKAPRHHARYATEGPPLATFVSKPLVADEKQRDANGQDDDDDHGEEYAARNCRRPGRLAIVSGRRTPRDFVKLNLIGTGDVGRVYLVRDRHTNQLFAMKVCAKEDLVARNKAARAMTELSVLRAMDHPFVVRLYHAFQSRSHLFMCLEYCAGGEFFRVLQRTANRRLDEPAARFYAAEVLCALEYLHLQGFIYRDLKLENVVMHASGHIKLADFDLSKPVASVGDAAVIRQSVSQQFFRSNDSKMHGQVDTASVLRGYRTKSFVGTEEYIAPEMLEDEHHDLAVDWWTLGIFIYELLYGRTPFKGKHRNETFHNILHKELAFPCDTSSAHFVVSPAAQNLMRRLLVKNPSNRLGSKFGGAEVKAQTWFRPIDWALLRNQRPPIIPQLANRYDTSHFRNYFKQVSFFCSGGGSGSGENDDGAIATSRMIADLPVEDGIAWETVEDALRRDAAREKHGLPIVDGSATFEEEDRASSDASVRANVSDDMDEHDLGDAATRHKDPFADFRAISILHDVESE